MKHSRSSLIIAATLVGMIMIALLMTAQTTPSQAEPPNVITLPDVPPTPTVPPAPGDGLAAPQVANALLVEQFGTAAALDSWRIVDLEAVPPERAASWIISDGRLRQNRTVPPLRDPSIHETAAFTGDATWTDYDDYDTTPKHVLEKVVNGNVTIIAALDAPGYGARTWHTITLSVNGSQLSASFDGQPTITANDTTLSSGEIGLYTRAIGGMLFDNVTVTNP